METVPFSLLLNPQHPDSPTAHSPGLLQNPALRRATAGGDGPAHPAWPGPACPSLACGASQWYKHLISPLH